MKRTMLLGGPLAAGLLAIVALQVSGSGAYVAMQSGRQLPSILFDERNFERAVAKFAREPLRAATASIVIVPHHWLPADLIVSGLREAAAKRAVRRVVLLGPNHIGAGHASVSTSVLSWQTPYGIAQPDVAVVGKLEASGLAEEEPDVLTYEHSIAGIVPAIRFFFPQARIVPLAIRGRASPAKVREIGEITARYLDASTVVVAAVDFAHDEEADVAPIRNRETVAALRNGDVARMLSFGNEHVDSPPSIAAVMIAARFAGLDRFVLLGDSDSNRYGGPPTGVTTYLVGAWMPA